MRSKLEVGTFQSAWTVVSSNNDPREEEPVNGDADRNIDCGFEALLDCRTKSIVEELTRIIRPLGLPPSGKLANSAAEEFGDLG